MHRERSAGGRRRSVRGLLRSIGPEVVSAASDNDPTNVGTAAALGAQAGYQLCWVAVLVAPLLGVVLTIAAQVGAVARDDLQSLTLKRYGRGVAAVLLVSVVVVNLVTIAADLQAGAAGIGLLAGIGSRWLVVPLLGAAVAGLLLAGKYGQVVAVLRYLMLGFLAFGAAAVLAHPDWPRLLEASVVPALSLRPEELAGGLALLGTTLTSYVYVWETIGRGVEEPPDRTPEGSGGLGRARAGAVAGAVLTAVILWFMLVASAATLGRHHQNQTVASAQDAARALAPAGRLCGRGPVRRRARHLGGGRAARADGHDRLRGRRTVQLAPRAVGGDRPRPALLRGPGRVHRARAGRVPGRDPGDRHAGGGKRDRRARDPDRPGAPGPPGPRSPDHGTSAHLSPAGHRGLGRRCYCQRLRPARHHRGSPRHVLT
jgi:hypothetical protein